MVITQLYKAPARRVAADILPVEAQHVAIYDFVLGDLAPAAPLFSEVLVMGVVLPCLVLRHLYGTRI